MSSARWWRWEGDDLLLELRVQPRAGRSVVADDGTDGAPRVRLAAPPVDGAANECLVRLLAEEFDVGRGSVELLAGRTGRNKRVRVTRPRRMPAWACVAAREER